LALYKKLPEISHVLTRQDQSNILSSVTGKVHNKSGASPITTGSSGATMGQYI